MTDLDQSFKVNDDPRLEVKLGSGSVRLLPGDAGSIEVSIQGSSRSLEKLVVEQRGNTVIVQQRQRRLGSLDVTVVLPVGASVKAELASADLAADVNLGSLTAVIGSGDVTARGVMHDASVLTASGDVRLASLGGYAHLATASGDIKIAEAAGELECKTMSGDVSVGRADGTVAAKTSSGDLKVEAFGGSALSFKTMSGDARIGLRPGLILDVDIETLSGDVRNDFGLSAESTEESKLAELAIKTLSGDITLFSA